MKVEIHKQTGEMTFDNNQAQENFVEFETAAASPYVPVELDFLARNPYEHPVVMDMQINNLPENWFVAVDHGSVWLPPRAEKPLHAVIWTDRGAEWTPEYRDESPRKPAINLEGWVRRWADQNFAVGGITALVQAVRDVELTIDFEETRIGVGNPFSFDAAITPNVGETPLAVHITNPDGEFASERTSTDSSGHVTYTTRYTAAERGRYSLQIYILGGELAGEAESDVFEIEVY